MSKYFLLIFFLLVTQMTLAAETYTCRAERVEGNTTTLRAKTYGHIFPTIYIDSNRQRIIYRYVNVGQQWRTVYRIRDENDRFIMAVEHLKADLIGVMLFDKRFQRYTILWSGAIGNSPLANTMTFGKCRQ